MKLILWIADVLAYVIYTALISVAILLIVQGTLYHSVEVQAAGLIMLACTGTGLALDWNAKAKEAIDGEVD